MPANASLLFGAIFGDSAPGRRFPFDDHGPASDQVAQRRAKRSAYRLPPLRTRFLAAVRAHSLRREAGAAQPYSGRCFRGCVRVGLRVMFTPKRASLQRPMKESRG
jgi:hypothetical protein